MADNLQYKLLALLLGGPDSEEITALKRGLAEAIRRYETPPAPQLPDARTQTQLLREAYGRLTIQHEFHPGHVVKWKSGLRNRLHPGPDQLGVVLEVLREPLYDTKVDSTNVVFREPLDICVGVLGPFNDLIPYWFDKRRFEPVQ